MGIFENIEEALNSASSFLDILKENEEGPEKKPSPASGVLDFTQEGVDVVAELFTALDKSGWWHRLKHGMEFVEKLMYFLSKSAGPIFGMVLTVIAKGITGGAHIIAALREAENMKGSTLSNKKPDEGSKPEEVPLYP